MTHSTPLHFLVTTLLLSGLSVALRAADDPTPPPGRPTREEMREKLKDLTPEQRQKKLAELRDKAGFNGPISEEMKKRRAEFESFRESIKDLPLPERETKLREWREKHAPLRPLGGPGGLTPEEREIKRGDYLKSIDDQLASLTKRKADGSLTEEESRRLERLQQMKQRLESNARPALGLPLPRPTEGKPVKPAEAK